MDNAPCHPAGLRDRLSNINIVFLPKKNTALKPLDSGIIASWKCRYKKRLLRHVCSKVDGSNSASDIVTSVNLLIAIEWGRQAWDDVKCFFAKSCILSCSLQFDNKKWGSPNSFLSYKRLKLKLRLFLAGHIVAMVTYCATKLTVTCSPRIGQFVDTMISSSNGIEWL